MLVAIFLRLLAVLFVPGFGSNHAIQQPSLIQGFLEWLKAKMGMGDSQGMMFLSRAFYATISLFTVSMVYRICDISFFLGLPLMLYGSNIVLRQQVLITANLNEKVHRTSYLIAGLMLGLSIAVWYQSLFLVLAILLMLCVKRDGRGALMTFIGIVFALLLVGVLLMILNVNPWHYIRP